MLVPLLNPVLVLLGPVIAALILEPGACVCTHAWRWLGAGAGGGAARTQADACGAGGQAEVGRPLGVASMCNICTVCPGWGQYGGSGLRGRCAQCGRRGEGDLHVDASAVVGERGLRASLSRGANEQLVRGSDGVC